MNHHSALRLLFLVYFVFFAVSPISYYCPENAPAHLTGDAGINGSVRLSFVLLEPFMKSDTDTDGAEDDTGTLKILLRKKRAVLSAKKLIDPTLLTCSLPGDLINKGILLNRVAFFAGDDPAAGRYSDLPYSGLSPPVVPPFI
ncbi:MAG: hypothetical protein EPN25_13200 [Nitrospirae bacterium]|nr:MAG: hypothetical protein EPN25_13200 [Nitrospirota bacterium]